MAFSGTKEEQAAKRKAWREKRKAEGKILKNDPRPFMPKTKPKQSSRKYGKPSKGGYFRDREMIRQLTEQAEFIRPLRELADNGSTSRVCPSCGQNDASWEEYFCRYCGEHHDQLYLEDHALAPILLTREQIMAEYKSVGLKFEKDTNPRDSGLRFLSYADMTGINHFAEMPRNYVAEKGGNQWEKLKGFNRSEESFPSTS